jgi:hypothetical protein
MSFEVQKDQSTIAGRQVPTCQSLLSFALNDIVVDGISREAAFKGGFCSQGRVRSLAIAWEQARAALQERQSSRSSTPHTSPRELPDPPVGSPGQPAQQLTVPGQEAERRIRHARNVSSPNISPCDSAYEAASAFRPAVRGAPPSDAEGPSDGGELAVGPRAQSELYSSPRKAALERATASDGMERYHRHPPVSSVGLAKLQVGGFQTSTSSRH